MTDPNQPPPIAGLLVIDKPLGDSSARVVAIVKRRLRAAGALKSIRVGHAGTLDPLATGVLVILVGKATKLQSTVMAGEKGYIASIDLSAFTTTDDAEGERTEIEVNTPPSRESIEAVLQEQFLGVIQQTPPSFSAIKVSGERAYKKARAGAPIELQPRPIRIDHIEVLSYAFPALTLEIKCGKGTYIRSIARDLGTALGTGGSLTGLVRTRVGPYSIEQALTLDQVPDPLPISFLRTTPETEALIAQHGKPKAKPEG